MNVSKHRQAILIFGVALPAVFLLALAGAALKARAKINQDHAAKVANLESYEAAKAQVNELDAMLATDNRREKIEYWNKKLEQDFVQSFTENLNRIMAKFDPDVLNQTAMGQATGVNSYGGQIDNPSTRIQLSFEGGFKPMQLLLAELEAEMPQLVLESISIGTLPAKSEHQTGLLSFSLVYLSWEKPRS